VIPRRFPSFWSLFGATVFLGALALPLLPAPAAAPAPSARDKEIAEIEKKIAELTRQLEELKKTSAPTTDPTKKVGQTLPPEWAGALRWRSIGPATMGGRIVAFAVYEADPTTYWIATASGGLLKTTNNGTTFEHQFDREATVSIGDVAVAPSNRNIVWVGTGENNPRNSVSYGDGVYKSTNGGKSWQNMGLKKSFQIGRIVIHPKNPDIVYVGALGRLYGPSAERGLYKTTDGGKTWTKILHVDNNTGVIELKMHPTDPESLLVATWQRQRDGFDSHSGAMAGQFFVGARVEPPLLDGYDPYDPEVKWGKGSAIWKTSDGGKNFRRIAKGLPTCELGRIGLDYYRKDPNVVFAVIDSAKIGMGTVPGYLGINADAVPEGVRVTAVTADGPADLAGLKKGDVITTVDKTAVKKLPELVKQVESRKPGDKLPLSLLRDKKPLSIVVTLEERPEPGPAGRQRGLTDFLGEDSPTGVRITAVFQRGGAGPSGLQVGDMITAVEKVKVTTLRAILARIRAVKPGQKVNLTLVRGKKTMLLAYTVPPRARPSSTRPYTFMYSGQRENVQDRQGPESHEYGGVYKSTDGGESWTRINSVNPRPMYFSQIRVDPADEKLLYVLGISLHRSTDGGKTFRMGGDRGVHPDHHAMWINPRDGRHLLIGTDGGSYVSYDRCEHWDYLNHAAIGQFYHVCVDNRRPYRVYGGMQDNGSWAGPSMTLDGKGVVNSDWMMVNGGDGFVCAVDPENPDIVYAESQDGNIVRRNIKTGEAAFIKPRNRPGQQPYRFNWNAPIVVSRHNSTTVYCAGNFVFRSVKRGNDFKAISPEITRSGKASATALSECPRNPDVLWAGTDDGQLWVTRDGGVSWKNITGKVGLPKPYWVATLEASRYRDGRCYVCLDAHRSDDDEPYIYVTEDYGETWKPLRANLPAGSTRCLREDLFREDLLYLGTEFAAWASIDRGASWTKINGNLPTVAVHELAQHPSMGEMVAATHGRSLWVLDVSPLRGMNAKTAKAPATLYEPNTAVRWRNEALRGTVYGMGARGYTGENPQPGAHLYYSLTKKARDVRVLVQDFTGKTVITLTGRPEQRGPGLHRLTWNLRSSPGLMGAMVPARFRGGMGNAAPAGQYRVVLRVDGAEVGSQGLKVENDPALGERPLITGEPPKRSRGPDDF
jgi:photosystem II stability/assembly factor-like uncharacterized protein